MHLAVSSNASLGIQFVWTKLRINLLAAVWVSSGWPFSGAGHAVHFSAAGHEALDFLQTEFQRRSLTTFSSYAFCWLLVLSNSSQGTTLVSDQTM